MNDSVNLQRTRLPMPLLGGFVYFAIVLTFARGGFLARTFSQVKSLT